MPKTTRLRNLLAKLALVVAVWLLPPPLLAQAQADPVATGGALLYQTHCIGCHSRQIHWRNAKLATDWASLSAQVRRWQANTGLQWTDEEIDEVANYLNRTIYKFPGGAPKQLG